MYKNWPISSGWYEKSDKYILQGILDASNGKISSQRYKELVVEQIEKQDNPLIEGGCSFYLRYLLESGHTQFTEEQMQEADRKALELLNNSEKKWQVLQQYCPTYDNSINENDNYRFQKALRYAILTDGKYFQHLPINSDQQLKNHYDVRGYFLFSGQNNLNKKIQHRYLNKYQIFFDVIR